MNEQNNNFGANNTPENPYNYNSAPQNPQSTPPYQPYQQPYGQPYPAQYQQPPFQETQMSEQEEKATRSSAVRAFVFGILAIEIPFIGIIFGAIAKGIGKHILRKNPAPSSNATRVFARLGRIFGLIGFIIGIVMTVLTPFYIIGFISGLIDALEFSLFF